jgi:hypothetical protein
MSSESEQFSAVLVTPDEYIRYFNQVALVNRNELTIVRRKLLSKGGWELVKVPMNECERILYKDEHSWVTMVSGALIVALIVFILVMMGIYWNDLPNETKVPIGALAVAAGFGVTRLFGSRRHRLVFVMRDGKKLIFKSRAGDYKAASYPVEKVLAFARNSGLLQV